VTLAALAAGCSVGAAGNSVPEEPTLPRAATATSSSTEAAPVDKAKEQWRRQMSKAPPTKVGCYDAVHPSTEWELSGTTVTGAQNLSMTCGAGCSSVWHPVLTAAMNNDGNTDVLWYNESTGQVSSWFLDGSTVVGTQDLSWTCTTASGCASTWSIVGAADVNGDGHTDLTLWDRSSGQVSSWLLNGSGSVLGTQVLSWTCSAASGCSVPGAWHAVGYVSLQ
jgi:hypothetical protein